MALRLDIAYESSKLPSIDSLTDYMTLCQCCDCITSYFVVFSVTMPAYSKNRLYALFFIVFLAIGKAVTMSYPTK